MGSQLGVRPRSESLAALDRPEYSPIGLSALKDPVDGRESSATLSLVFSVEKNGTLKKSAFSLTLSIPLALDS
jgi:hypothetical protein